MTYGNSLPVSDRGYVLICQRDITERDIGTICGPLQKLFTECYGLCSRHSFHISGNKIVFDKYPSKALQLPRMNFKEGDEIVTSLLTSGSAPSFSMYELIMFEWAFKDIGIKVISFPEIDSNDDD